jgi:penicillin-binding protein 1A
VQEEKQAIMSDEFAPHVPLSNVRPRRRARRIFLQLVLLVLLLMMAGAASMLVFYGRIAARYDLSKLGEMRERSVVYDVKGREIGRLHGENRVVVPLEQVSPNFVKALLAREDTRFYQHSGVDYIGVVRAIYRDVKERAFVQGASTITMQLARNSFEDMSAKTAHRKLVEAMLADRIERTKTKEEILELYVNRIFFGTGMYGIERASRAYFAKPASALSVGEGAMLAGIIRSPNRFSPFRNWKGALRERDTVLARMVEKKYLTPEQAAAAKSEDMVPAAQPVFRTQDNYMMEAVRRDLDQVLGEQDIEDGGLEIYTTLDLDLQKAATDGLEKHLKSIEAEGGFKHESKAAFDARWNGEELSSTPYLQGALLAIDNHTGGILAVVGGRDFIQSRFDRAMQSTRAIGSTIKPFVYSAGFLHGLLPGTLVEDAPIRPGELRDSDTNWSPGNADGKFLGWQTVETGLVRSRNAMSVRVGNHAGLDGVIDLLRQAGLGEPQVRTPQIYIGNMGSNLRALTSAMSIYPNHGVRRRPFLIQRINDSAGEVVYSTPVLETEVLPAGVAKVTRGIMEKIMDEGTAAAARSQYGFKARAGGKTGTTNDYNDAWFVGYTGEVTCGVWVGFDSPKTIMSGGYGARLSLPVWCEVMNKALELNYQPQVAEAEPVEAQVNLCRISGKLATAGCKAHGHAYTDELPYEMVPQGFCNSHGGAVPVAEQPRPREGVLGRIFRWFR